MATLPTSTPSKLTAGDSAEWTISLPDYPASAWTLTYYLVKEGRQVVIEPDFAQKSSGYDDRSTARIALDAIEAIIKSGLFTPHKRYQIAGRAMEFRDFDELLTARDRFRAEVRAEERRKAGKPAFGAVKVRFR